MDWLIEECVRREHDGICCCGFSILHLEEDGSFFLWHAALRMFLLLE